MAAEPDRTALRALTPDRYLAEGWQAPEGGVRREATGLWATAAAEQLLAADVPAAEVAATYEAFRQVLPYYGAAAAAALDDVRDEALDLVAKLLGQPNHHGLRDWAAACLARVREPQDVEAFMAHFRAVSLQYEVIAGAAAAGVP